MKNTATFPIVLFSFGYKYGAPQDVNFLFDVRFLANPFHRLELRSLTGLTPPIADFVLGSDPGRECLEQLHRIGRFHAQQLQQSGKDGLRMAIGCTGGHHRSVAITEALAIRLQEEFSDLRHFHRDLQKEHY